MDSGALTPEDAERILLLQKEQGLRFGEAAVKLGLLTEADIQYALSRQFSYAYLRTVGDKKPLSDELVAGLPAVQPARRGTARDPQPADAALVRQDRAAPGADRRRHRARRGPQLPGGQPAVVFSQLGERTLLIDADMRSPRQHELFLLQNKVGLSTVLSGRSRDEAIIRITDLAGLYVLPAGPVPPNPLELLSRLNFDEFLIHVRATFDVVIIDTPALSARRGRRDDRRAHRRRAGGRAQRRRRACTPSTTWCKG
jgi:receptor protein-tyrosine kinase